MVDGVVAFADLSFETRGARPVIVGEYEPLTRALYRGAAAAAIVGGKVTVMGRDVASGAHFGAVGVASVDPVLPTDHTVESYLHWSARLAGMSRAEARARADERLQTLFGARPPHRRMVQGLDFIERRLLGLAFATMTSPAALIVIDPFVHLDVQGAERLAAALDFESATRPMLVCLPKSVVTGPAATLVSSATSLTVLRAGRVAYAGDVASLLAGARLFSVTTAGDGERLREALLGLGAEVLGGPVHFTVALPEGVAPKSIVAAAAGVGLGLLGCVPIE